MDKKTMEEFIFSLAWYDASAYHYDNVLRILKDEFPGDDFSEILARFETCNNMPPGPGCPR